MRRLFSVMAFFAMCCAFVHGCRTSASACQKSIAAATPKSTSRKPTRRLRLARKRKAFADSGLPNATSCPIVGARASLPEVNTIAYNGRVRHSTYRTWSAAHARSPCPIAECAYTRARSPDNRREPRRDPSGPEPRHVSTCDSLFSETPCLFRCKIIRSNPLSPPRPGHVSIASALVDNVESRRALWMLSLAALVAPRGVPRLAHHILSLALCRASPDKSDALLTRPPRSCRALLPAMGSVTRLRERGGVAAIPSSITCLGCPAMTSR